MSFGAQVVDVSGGLQPYHSSATANAKRLIADAFSHVIRGQ